MSNSWVTGTLIPAVNRKRLIYVVQCKQILLISHITSYPMFLFGLCLLVFLKKTLKMFFNGNTIAFLNIHSVFFYVYFRFSIQKNLWNIYQTMDHCQHEWENNISSLWLHGWSWRVMLTCRSLIVLCRNSYESRNNKTVAQEKGYWMLLASWRKYPIKK